MNSTTPRSSMASGSAKPSATATRTTTWPTSSRASGSSWTRPCARLDAAAADAARERGFSAMRLFVAAGQSRARAFYERAGWAPVSEPFHDPVPGLAMVEYRRAVPDRDGDDSLTRGSAAQRPEEPKPSSPRVSGPASRSSTTRTSGATNGTSTSWAMRSPARTACGRVAGVEQRDPQLAAVAGVDEAGRVDDRDAVARGEPRARRDEPGDVRRQRDRDAGPDRAPARGPQA